MIVNLMKLQPQTEHPHGLSDLDFDALSPRTTGDAGGFDPEAQHGASGIDLPQARNGGRGGRRHGEVSLCEPSPYHRPGATVLRAVANTLPRWKRT